MRRGPWMVVGAALLVCVVPALRGCADSPEQHVLPDPDESASSAGWNCIRPSPRVRFVVTRNGEPVPGVRIGWTLAMRRSAERPWEIAPLGPFESDRLNSETDSRNGESTWPTESPLSPPTGPDGVAHLDVLSNVTLRPLVRDGDRTLPLAERPTLRLAGGATPTVELHVLPEQRITGRCLGPTGDALENIAVQAFDGARGRSISRVERTDADGRFDVLVTGTPARIELRAMQSLREPWRTIDQDPQDIPPILGPTTVPDLDPGAGAVEIRLRPAPSVVLELREPNAPAHVDFVQVDPLVFDDAARAWRRTDGPVFLGRTRQPTSGSSFVAIRRSTAERPLLIWAHDRSFTVVDASGADRAAVTLPAGRRVSVRGERWRSDDELRVICRFGPPGHEVPCIWVEGRVRKRGWWSRADAPPVPIEFQLVRGGDVIAWSDPVPASDDAAAPVRLDAPE